MLGWKEIIEFQDKFYPDWRKKPRLLFSNALAGECGEVCGVITHLEGGGTNLQEYSNKQVLEECADLYIQLVLLIAMSGFTRGDFENQFWKTMIELNGRLNKKHKRKML